MYVGRRRAGVYGAGTLQRGGREQQWTTGLESRVKPNVVSTNGGCRLGSGMATSTRGGSNTRAAVGWEYREWGCGLFVLSCGMVVELDYM